MSEERETEVPICSHRNNFFEPGKAFRMDGFAFHFILCPSCPPHDNILPDIFLKCLSDPCLAFLPAPTTPIPLPSGMQTPEAPS